jgi:hypothetical protein
MVLVFASNARAQQPSDAAQQATADAAPQSNTGEPASPHRLTDRYAHGIPLPGDIRLNGRFDINYERIKYSDNPFSDGRDSLRNYHRFIFLSREAKGDPLTINAELVDQLFYEFALKLPLLRDDLSASITGGKILVPFGAEPLFHHTYGGTAGFDQQLVPTVWAQPGASLSIQYHTKAVRLTNDLYTVQGYRLPGPESVLDLQNNFSRTDHMQMGVGDRIGIAWGPISAWYSIYLNKLGFHRRLVLQALDISIWRPVNVPVLRDISVDLGILRADVSGGNAQGHGGPGKDYYHFADYLQVRYRPAHWIYVQYRTGIVTFDNRRGDYVDKSRLDELDVNNHNVGVVARYRGLTAGLYHFWKFERRNEQRDDRLRLTVAYEF